MPGLCWRSGRDSLWLRHHAADFYLQDPSEDHVPLGNPGGWRSRLSPFQPQLTASLALEGRDSL